MAFHLDEEESEFFSAAMSFLDDFPTADHPNEVAGHHHHLQRFEELPDDHLLPAAGHGDVSDVGSLPSLDGVELQGLADLCLPVLDHVAMEVSGVVPGQASSSGECTQESESTEVAGRRSRKRRSPKGAASKAATPNEKPKPKSHLPYNPNKARDERKLELIYLRKKVKEMEEQLDMLQHVKEEPAWKGSSARHKALLPDAQAASSTAGSKARGQVVCVSTTPSSSPPDGSMPGVWKELCLRQLQRRVKAERENSRLKRELESQIKVAKSMEKLLKKPSGVKEEKSQQHKRARSVHVPPTDPSADAAIFEELIAGVEASYHDVDAVFTDIGLTDLESGKRGAHVREGEHGMYLDIFANSVLPFDMNSTGEAVWEYFKGLRKHRGPLYEKTMKSLEPTEDTIIENFALELFANNTRADFRIRQVVRRYVEEDRIMVVWTAHVEPVAIANKIFSGFGFREKAYVVCTRPPSSAESNPDAFTVLQRCLRITPHAICKHEAPVNRRLDSATVGTLTEFVLSLCAADMAADQELIENVLVDQAINQHARR